MECKNLKKMDVLGLSGQFEINNSTLQHLLKFALCVTKPLQC